MGKIFGGLFSFLGNLFKNLFGVIWDVIKWIGKVLAKLFQNLLDVIIGFFKVIYALIDGLLYLLYMIGVLAIKLFLVIFEAAKVLYSFIVGFVKTLGSLAYSPRSTGGNGYSEMIGKLFKNLEVLQLNSVAYILLFVLWFTTAIMAIKLLSSIRVGGD
ncbi:hypothetical protein LCY76_22760 [Fictibacillus sp. KIGAM418]|uniref:Uncharacterized protein n=1 Tax=Fictibacillus marinisediminis TaxID=2878389 RepID=A0A9X1XEF7_9BACL|nr:hypothetical protein [Fictibacillus marinisediminis]MCK6259397.1 hypothetical protein [Fictibacillus marinisediminis]